MKIENLNEVLASVSGVLTLRDAAKELAGSDTKKVDGIVEALRAAIELDELQEFKESAPHLGLPIEKRMQNQLLLMQGIKPQLLVQRLHLNAWLKSKGAKVATDAATPANQTPKPKLSLASLVHAKNEPETPEQRRKHVQAVVEKHRGNKTQAAHELGISRPRVSQIVNEKPKKTAKPTAHKPFG